VITKPCRRSTSFTKTKAWAEPLRDAFGSSGRALRKSGSSIKACWNYSSAPPHGRVLQTRMSRVVAPRRDHRYAPEFHIRPFSRGLEAAPASASVNGKPRRGSSMNQQDRLSMQRCRAFGIRTSADAWLSRPPSPQNVIEAARMLHREPFNTKHNRVRAERAGPLRLFQELRSPRALRRTSDRVRGFCRRDKRSCQGILILVCRSAAVLITRVEFSSGWASSFTPSSVRYVARVSSFVLPTCAKWGETPSVSAGESTAIADHRSAYQRRRSHQDRAQVFAQSDRQAVSAVPRGNEIGVAGIEFIHGPGGRRSTRTTSQYQHELQNSAAEKRGRLITGMACDRHVTWRRAAGRNRALANRENGKISYRRSMGPLSFATRSFDSVRKRTYRTARIFYHAHVSTQNCPRDDVLSAWHRARASLPGS
jgi:hypothetical protein